MCELYARLLSNNLLNVVPPSRTLNTFHLVMACVLYSDLNFSEVKAGVEYRHAFFILFPLPVCVQPYISTGSYRQLTSKFCLDLPGFWLMAFVRSRSQSRVTGHSSCCWQSHSSLVLFVVTAQRVGSSLMFIPIPDSSWIFKKIICGIV